MQYGEKKLRDMARSVLPSTRRKSAKAEKQQVARKNRRQINRDCKASISYEDYLECPAEDHKIDTRKKADNYTYLLSNRRGADKVGPLIRWAQAKVRKENIDLHNAEFYFKAILPKNLIGNHAWTHLEYYLRPKYDHHSWYTKNTFEERLLKPILKRLQNMTPDQINVFNNELNKVIAKTQMSVRISKQVVDRDGRTFYQKQVKQITPTETVVTRKFSHVQHKYDKVDVPTWETLDLPSMENAHSQMIGWLESQLGKEEPRSYRRLGKLIERFLFTHYRSHFRTYSKRQNYSRSKIGTIKFVDIDLSRLGLD